MTLWTEHRKMLQLFNIFSKDRNKLWHLIIIKNLENTVYVCLYNIHCTFVFSIKYKGWDYLVCIWSRYHSNRLCTVVLGSSFCFKARLSADYSFPHWYIHRDMHVMHILFFIGILFWSIISILIYLFAYCNLFIQIVFILLNRHQQGFIPLSQYAAMTGQLQIIAISMTKWLWNIQ